MVDIKDAARRATPDSAGEWVEKLARFGYAAKGTVHVIVGGFAFAAAFMAGRQVTDNKGALAFIASQPFGQILLGIVGLGLAAFALWRMVQAIKDPENVGGDSKGKARRVGYAVSGLIYGSLAVAAWGILFGSRSSSSGGETSAQGWTATLMAQPFGRWLVVVAGLIIIGVGIAEFVQAWSGSFMKHIKTWTMEPQTTEWVKRAGRLGRVARGVVFLIVGGFLLVAAWNYNPQQARGMSGALIALQQQPYGPWLLAIVGAGLVCYGLFEFVNARYRAISPNPLA